ncbi:glycerol-3-phosphate acyltransferase [bacterium]|nr:glycerol-3-phosphate acyltransferase [bacterium]
MTNDIFIYFLLITNSYIFGLLPIECIAARLKIDNGQSSTLKEMAVFSLGFLKGFLAVFIATLFNVPLQVLALCGIAAIIGHSWSPFFNFKDTKGFSVLLGALLPLYFPLVLIMLLICIIFSILWTIPVAIMISILLGVTMSFASVNLWNVFFLLIFALFVFTIKRILPLNDILPLEKNRDLLENRILFASDNIPDFRRKTNKQKVKESEVKPKKTTRKGKSTIKENKKKVAKKNSTKPKNTNKKLAPEKTVKDAKKPKQGIKKSQKKSQKKARGTKKNLKK